MPIVYDLKGWAEMVLRSTRGMGGDVIEKLKTERQIRTVNSLFPAVTSVTDLREVAPGVWQ